MSVKQNIHTLIPLRMLCLPSLLYIEGKYVVNCHLLPEVFFAQFIFCKYAPHTLLLCNDNVLTQR